ncbi:hypothetical protein HQ544_03600 [Candidatus Falkowbacteria bacterium]|nr:hypothetical protein [Candidatus Falkowbacteria bacterium]
MSTDLGKTVPTFLLGKKFYVIFDYDTIKSESTRPTSPACHALRQAMAGRPSSELDGGRANECECRK